MGLKRSMRLGRRLASCTAAASAAPAGHGTAPVPSPRSAGVDLLQLKPNQTKKHPNLFVKGFASNCSMGIQLFDESKSISPGCVSQNRVTPNGLLGTLTGRNEVQLFARDRNRESGLSEMGRHRLAAVGPQTMQSGLQR